MLTDDGSTSVEPVLDSNMGVGANRFILEPVRVFREYCTGLS